MAGHKDRGGRGRGTPGRRFRASVPPRDGSDTTPAPRIVEAPRTRDAPSVQVEQTKDALVSWLHAQQGQVSHQADHYYLDRLVTRLEARSHGLAHFPETPLDLDRVLCEPEPLLADIVVIVERDPELVRRIWVQANSPRYARGVTDLSRAITRLGYEQIWRLGVQEALRSLALAVPGYQEQVEAVRDEGLLIAELAAWASKESRGPHYLAGLFSGVGKLLLFQDTTAVGRLERPRPALVERVVKRCHTRLAYLAVHTWGLGSAIAGAVGWAEQPRKAPLAYRPMAAVVHCAAESVRAAGSPRQRRPMLMPCLSLAPEIRVGADDLLCRAQVLVARGPV